MLSASVLLVFVPTFAVVSLTPGMCMTLALTLGMSQGFRRVLWMIGGVLLGVGIVATSSAIGVAAVLLKHPDLFLFLKIIGGSYLIYSGYMLWRAGGVLLHPSCARKTQTPSLALFGQGFIVAISNPKAWAFFIALLPPFIAYDRPLALQVSVLVGIILLIECCALMLYALGGRTLRSVLQQEKRVKVFNRSVGVLMVGVGIWLMVD